MGYDVEIIALQKGDTQNTHAAYTSMGWRRKPAGCRMSRPEAEQAAPPGQPDLAWHPSPSTWRALNVSRYGAESRNLILSAICGQTAQPYRADVFIAHFGPAGVTAANCANWGD
jgi:colanic acid/amylovoran biosynthesis glycosyltransferase